MHCQYHLDTVSEIMKEYALSALPHSVSFSATVR